MSIFHGKLRISLPFVLLVSFMYAFDTHNILILVLAAMLLHELSHIVAIKLCGGSIGKIDISALGIRIDVPELDFINYKKEIIIAATGPATGLIMWVASVAAARAFHLDALYFFSGANAIISIINLLPVYPLDGGRIVLSFCLMYLPLRAAYAISYIMALFSIALVFGLCAFLALEGRLNPSLVIFALFLALSGLRNQPLI